jgi:hypothetical protein
MGTAKNHITDIFKNLTIEQMLARAHRRLPPEQQAELTAISSRTGIHMNDLLKEALDIGLTRLKAQTMNGRADEQ